ncbi:hypothetical protein PsorP6_001105 [Peronosclerospora sorghi]|uniref:Uncharacterized protein n=1 Tax=Peronosclerospora sorghi TaxID=230839 RepID=A0ACC0WTA8_9STRA|nr:hypothetical protein PsorP6_001105 [Peronosclerospora sorghi]
MHAIVEVCGGDLSKSLPSKIFALHGWSDKGFQYLAVLAVGHGVIKGCCVTWEEDLSAEQHEEAFFIITIEI